MKWKYYLPIKIFAAGLSTYIDFKIVAPSFVTVIFEFYGPGPTGLRILSFIFILNRKKMFNLLISLAQILSLRVKIFLYIDYHSFWS